MTSSGYWVNNEHIVFKHAIKPCKFCGFCPYGQLVEDFPVPSLTRAEALEHHKYMVDALAKGVFDNKICLMTRKEAELEIKEFNEKDYPEKAISIDKMQCSEFGHHCPVYYHAELFSESDEVTQEEIHAFKKEIDEHMEKIKNRKKK